MTRQPVHRPVVTVAIIVANALVFFAELAGGDAFVQRWSLIPANILAGHDWITILTSMFMHGGWMHIIGNMVFFWAFGPEIEDAMGPFRYLAFYLLSGLIASLAQIAAAPTSTIPNLGASGAIAGVMGAFLITYPRDEIKTLLIPWVVHYGARAASGAADWVLVPAATGERDWIGGQRAAVWRRGVHGARGRFYFWDDRGAAV